MLNVLHDGGDRHRLEDAAGRRVGWIHGRAIGFASVAEGDEIPHAALAGARALQAALRRAYPGWPPYEPEPHALRLVHDGAYTWVSDGKVPIARVVRPRVDATADPRLGLEYVLPSYASAGVAISAAQSLARALQAHLRGAPEGGEDAWIVDDPPPAIA